MKNNVLKIIILLILCIVILIGCGIVIKKILPGYENTEITDMVNLVINNSNVTDYLKERNREVYILENGTIYLSIYDIENFFDKYIYIEEQYNQVISTYNSNILIAKINDNTVKINGKEYKINAKTIEKNGIIYLPFSEIQQAYDAKVKYIDSTNTVIIDTLDRDKTIATINNSTNLKSRSRNLSRTVEKLQENEEIVIISKNDNWSKVRSEKGKIGYVKNKYMSNAKEVKSSVSKEKQINEKINMVWDYFYSQDSIPNRENEEIQGINVISPSFFTLSKYDKGNINIHIGEKGEEYIEWAHNNNYKVWAMLSNDSSKEITSEIMRDYKLREKLINNIIEKVEYYNLDGINIDFENMYKEDKKLFSQFIIELTPRIHALGKTISVDVTAPDGDDNWSMCYDRNVIGDVADYIVFMAYDQYGESSTEAGTTSGYGWVRVNLKKFIETEEILSEKIILGLPFYTRVWVMDGEKLINTKTIAMKHIDSNIPQNAKIVWDDLTRQNVVEYKENGYTKKIWIEDIKSYKEKLNLVNQYELGGVANWCKDMENSNIWKVIEEELK